MDKPKDPNRPYYTVALWYPYFFIGMGIFFFVATGVSFQLLTTELVFDIDLIQRFGSTFPVFFLWLGAAAFGSLLLIAIGLHMLIFAHKE